MSPDLIGWAASLILLATLARQIYTQSKDKSAKGVSHWLFAGQMLASLGFIAYSWMVGNWVFIVTNSMILMTAIIGQWVMLRSRSGKRSR
jgi:MtN3 and saliva related transmembrane protein